jgi:hypothetical protein
MSTVESPPVSPSGLRIRIGVSLVVMSWIPIAQIVIAVASLSGAGAQEVRLAIWSVQVVIGLVGVAVAGKPTIDIVKRVGWRRAPRVLWSLLWRGEAPATPEGSFESRDRPQCQPRSAE